MTVLAECKAAPRCFLAVLAGLIILLSQAQIADAQDRAILIADRVEVLGGNVLRAEGNVEVIYTGRRLSARAVRYDAATDSLTAEGPIRLTEGDGFVIVGDFAELDDGFRNGMLQSARLVLEQELQIAANEIVRAKGRYTQLTRTVASTCQVCDASQLPLWQIRATRVVHDNVEKQLYFDNAIFQVLGVPVFYVPRLRLPDPSVDRARGFLIPGIRSSSRLGTGIVAPYFVPLGDSADVTLTPYVSPSTETLAFRHRNVQKNGAVQLAGAISNDNIRDRDVRGYLFGSGLFFLDDDIRLGFNLELASDDSYLSDYSISGQDRARSDVLLTRVKRDALLVAEAISYRTYRSSESNDTIPSVIGRLAFGEKFAPPGLGGVASFQFEAYGLNRTSDADVEGRDYGRLSSRFGWWRSETFGPGIEGNTEVRLNANYYDVDQDSTQDNAARVTTQFAVGARWPLEKTASNGYRHVLEPAAQLVWSTEDGDELEDEEGTLVDFDEGNLFSLSRIPGHNRYESGARLNLGGSWHMSSGDGFALSLSGGRVFRSDDERQFTPASGLDGMRSDWLASVQLNARNGIRLANRTLIDDSGNLTKNEGSLSFSYRDLALSSGYLWLIAEPEVGRDLDSQEVSVSARYDITDSWRAIANARYDFVADRAARTGFGLQFRNECIEVDLSYARSFTSSAAVEPNTRFNFLIGLPRGAGAKERRQRCYG
ncbi:MAG: LPS assembly protein LptD [Pseudomonadota bacterium]